MDEENHRILTKCLNNILTKENYHVIKYEFPNIQYKGGFIAELINVKTTVEKNGTIKILDLLIKTNQNTNHNLTEAYLKEMQLYSKIIPSFNQFAEYNKIDKFENIPYCHGVYSEQEMFFLVLDNLNSKGFKVRKFEPFDLQHIRLVLEAYARWHAYSFALRDQKPDEFWKLLPPNKKLEDTVLLNSITLTLEQQIDFVIGLYESKKKTVLLDKLKALRTNFRALLEEYLKNEGQKYTVINHADVWNNNCMFKYNEKSQPIEVKILDWQTTVLGSPMLDVAQIFFFCCIREELEHMDELLKFYYTTLSEQIRHLGSNPEECFPWDACLESFQRFAPLGIAGVPFMVRMYFSDKFMNDSKGHEDVADGDFTGIIGEEISEPEAFFERLNGILELCVERNLI